PGRRVPGWSEREPLPGLFGAAVRAADGRLDLGLEDVAAAAVVDRSVLDRVVMESVLLRRSRPECGGLARRHPALRALPRLRPVEAAEILGRTTVPGAPEQILALR